MRFIQSPKRCWKVKNPWSEKVQWSTQYLGRDNSKQKFDGNWPQSSWHEHLWQEHRVGSYSKLWPWHIHLSSVTSPSAPHTPRVSAGAFTLTTAAPFEDACESAASESFGPLMCVSLSESLVPDGWWREEGGGDGEIFPSISRVLVPLADTPPLCCSLPECTVRVSPVQSCGCRGRQGDGLGLCWPGHWRKWRRNFMCDQAVSHCALEHLYTSPLNITASIIHYRGKSQHGSCCF